MKNNTLNKKHQPLFPGKKFQNAPIIKKINKKTNLYSPPPPHLKKKF